MESDAKSSRENVVGRRQIKTARERRASLEAGTLQDRLDSRALKLAADPMLNTGICHSATAQRTGQIINASSSKPTDRRVAPVNRLLTGLPRGESQRLLAECKAVELKLGKVLYEPNARIRHVYFPTDSFVSLMIPVDGITNLEVGLVGNEGMVGHH